MSAENAICPQLGDGIGRDSGYRCMFSAVGRLSGADIPRPGRELANPADICHGCEACIPRDVDCVGGCAGEGRTQNVIDLLISRGATCAAELK